MKQSRKLEAEEFSVAKRTRSSTAAEDTAGSMPADTDPKDGVVGTWTPPQRTHDDDVEAEVPDSEQ